MRNYFLYCSLNFKISVVVFEEISANIKKATKY